MKPHAKFLALVLVFSMSGAIAQETKTETNDSLSTEESVESEVGELSNAEAQQSQQTSTSSTPIPTPPVGVVSTGVVELVKNVGTDGSFSYRVPFDIPEFRGLQPNLGLAYNSGNRRRGGSMSITGIGWSLTGLSKIDRVSVGLGSPSFDDDRDIYRLDGMELLKCDSGDYPTDWVATETSASCSVDGEYVTLKENYKRIRFNAAANEWNVTDTSGVRYIYSALGDATGHTAVGTDQERILEETTWVLTSIFDTQDNVNNEKANLVTFEYLADANNGFAYRPDAINYAIYGSSPGYRVKFSYDTPTLPMASFATGTTIVAVQTYRLKSVQVRSNGGKLRAYDLGYTGGTATGASLLEKVTQYGDDFVEATNGGGISGGSALPNPYEFKYSADKFTTIEMSYTGSQLNSQYIPWDTDSDQKDELYFGRKSTPSDTCEAGDPNIIGFNLPPKAYEVLPDRSLFDITPGTSSFLFEALSSTTSSNNDYYSLAGITQFDPTTKTNYGIFVEHTFTETSSGWIESFQLETHDAANIDPVVDSLGFGLNFPGVSIVNAEGKPHSQMNSTNGLYDLSSGMFVNTTIGGIAAGSPNQFADINGNGRTNGIGPNSSSSFFPWRVSAVWDEQIEIYDIPLPDSVIASLSGKWALGDVNGDGADDFVHLYRASNTFLTVSLSSGQEFVQPPQSAPRWLDSNELPSSVGPLTNIQIRDVNADGLGDLILYGGSGPAYQCGQANTQADPYTAGNASIFLSTGSSFNPQEITIDHFVGMGDFDGDGLVDFVEEGDDGSIHFGDSGETNNTHIPNLLIEVTDTLGGITTASYVPSSQPGVVTNDRIPGAQQLVSSIGRNGGVISTQANANDYTVSFDYDDSKYDYDLRKPLGFGMITALLPSIDGEGSSRPAIVTEYLNDNYAEAGLIDRRRTTFDGILQEQTNNSWTITNAGNGPFRAQKTAVRSVTRYDGDLIRTQEEFTYDIYGQVTLAVDQGLVDGSGTDLTDADDTARGFSYTRDTSNSTNYIMDRPRWERLYSGDSTPVDRTGWLEAFWYYYDDHTGNNTAPDEGNLTLTEQWRGNVASNNARTELELVYDAYGNVTTSTNARGNDTTYSYDTLYNLFAETETNAINQATSTTWDRACQKPTKIVDINSLDTDFTYDVFCREIEREIPGGQTFLTSYNNLGDPDAQYIETEQKSGSIDTSANYTRYRTRQYFDGLGQVYKSTMPAGNGNQANFIVTLNNYDNRGNLRWTSIPLSWADALDNDAGTNERTRFSYDPINRQIETLFADGSEATVAYLTEDYAYYDNTTLTYPVVRTKDALCEGGNEHGTGCGQIDVLMDHRGNMIRETKYDFDRTDVNGSGSDERYTYFAYDLRNLLYSIEDMSGAIWCYGYDAYGNRTNILDPDLGGWLDTNTVDCGEPAFAFGAGSWTLDYNANNFLSSQTDSVGNVVSYTYDDIDRITEKDVDAVTSNDLRTEYSYDQRSVSNENEGFLTQLEIFSGTSTNYYHRIRYDYGENGQLARERHDIALPGTTARSYDIQNEYRPNYALERQFLPTTQHSGGNSGWSAHRFFYDAGDRLISVGTPTGNNWIESIDYNLWNNPTHMRFFSTVNDHHIDNQRDYDAQRGWLDEIRVADVDTSDPLNPTSTNKDRTIYARDDIGRVTKQTTDTVQQGAWYDYTYDNAGRLLTATNFSSQSLDSWDRVFTYDRASRMRSKQDGTASATAYTYNANNRPAHAPRQIGGVTIDYDNNGNMEDSPSGRTMSYDGENRPVVVDNAGIKTAYTYGADGTRLLRAVGGGDLTLTFANIEIRNYNTNQWLLTQYINPNIRIVGGDVSFLHLDQLESVRLITDDAGNTLKRTLYKPFGSATDYNTTTDEDKTFLSQRYDEDAALQYLNARYYDPELALFITPDWLMPTEPGVGTNRFSYSMNDPVNLSDPSGNSWLGKQFWTRVINRASANARSAIARTVGQNGQIGSRIVEPLSKAVDNFDTANSFFSGDPVGIAMSFMPGADLARLAQLARVETLTRRAELALDALKNRRKLGGRLSGTPAPGETAHHLIPADVLPNEGVQKALEGGFDFNSPRNGMWALQHGGHPRYNRRVRDRIENAFEENPGLSPEEARNLLQEIADDFREEIIESGNEIR